MMPDKRTDGKTTSKDNDVRTNPYLSRREAATLLRITTGTLDKIVRAHGIRTFQVPGHNRRWIDRQAVEKLAVDAVGQEARA